MSLFTLILPILLLILLDEYSLAQKTIPDDIRKKLSQARTFSELLPVIQLSFAPHLFGNGGKSMLKHHKELQSTEIESHMNRTQNVEFFGLRGLDLSRKSDSQQTVDDNTASSLEILRTVRQGADTCELHKACIPILAENSDPGLLIFPKCYEITQCIGSCCEFTERCHPTSTEYIQQPIIEMLYAGNNLFVINQTRNITVEQHTACSCRMCTRIGAAVQCPQKKIVGPDCECECRNRGEKKIVKVQVRCGMTKRAPAIVSQRMTVAEVIRIHTMLLLSSTQ
ncbi:hypothetical protein WUBG_07355 [Wuchereria bancrofti]|uniref:Platelet-derived growth factor (PDGF) family profile domain-containing protein n=1 Tax=Wuchereria bancrofti TaxID=6293 RepID=J9B414_WUCBA|nr:hypothetical protein WUBG_07355 [Wuchereria bancrofti]